jgi:hypothetical protein
MKCKMGSFMSFAVEREMYSIMLAAAFPFDRVTVPELKETNAVVASFRIEKAIKRLLYMFLSAWSLYEIDWSPGAVAMVVKPIATFDTGFWMQMNKVMRARMSFREVCELRVGISEKLRNAQLKYLQLMSDADADADDDDSKKPPTSWANGTTSSYLSMLAIVDLAAMQIVEDVVHRLTLPENASKFAQVCDVDATFPSETNIAFPDALEVESFLKRAPIIRSLVPFIRDQLIKMGARRMVSGIITDLSKFLGSRIKDDIDDLIESVDDKTRIVQVFVDTKKEREREKEMSASDIIAALIESMQWDSNREELRLSLLEGYEVPEDAVSVSLSIAYKNLGKWLEDNVMIPAARSRSMTYVHAYASVQCIARHLGTHIRAVFLSRSEESDDDLHLRGPQKIIVCSNSA